MREHQSGSGRRSVYVDGLNFKGMPIPYGSKAGRFFVSSGISGTDPATSELADGDARQIELIFENMRMGVEAAGGTVQDILKCTFHVRDESVRAHIHSQWLAMFPDPESRPARHTMIYGFPKQVAAMVEFMAVLPAD
jgi:2-iminobutanoate/2-iminopropanoate deaminase